ncbi:spore germination protein GerPB [Jeotgalibacillus soli]|uniref:Spore germination protein n=1 Tax=Jeotgalibacillus soli TaxID=889306 RepID=A0A0C2VMI2_9BACL|nr:spore germination protein GerPB [Jeotgalibacillus soli]KIL45646.1 spore germination protein [Jeotgalibacillus soli]
MEPNWIIHQHITINMIKIGSMANSSILQIGTVGTIQARAELSNSGGFTKPAPSLTPAVQDVFVPLTNP